MPYHHHSHTTGAGVSVGTAVVAVVVRVLCVTELSVGVETMVVAPAGKFREGQGTVGATAPAESQALG